MFTTYVIQNESGKKYIGFTKNLKKRMKEHNDAKGKKRGWTRLRGPWRLIHKEEFEEKTGALKREKFLKTGVGREFLKSCELESAIAEERSKTGRVAQG
jgi:putative endonuclease